VGYWGHGEVYPQGDMSESEIFQVSVDIITSGMIVGTFLGLLLAFFGEGK